MVTIDAARDRSGGRRPGWRVSLAAFTLFAILAVLAGHPVARDLGRTGFGGLRYPTMNGEIFLSAVMSDSLRQGRPLRWFVTDLVNYPEGQDLGPRVAHSLHIYLEQLSALAWGPVVGLGLTGLLLLTLNGFCAWFVTQRLTGSRVAALTAGVLFELNSYTLLELSMGSLHKACLFWLPLLLLALLRLREGGGARAALTGGALLALGYLAYPIYAFYGLVLAALFTLWTAAERRSLVSLGEGLLLLGGFAALALAADLAMGFEPWRVGVAELSVKRLPSHVSHGNLDLLHPWRTRLPPPTDLPLGLGFVGVAAALASLWRRPDRTPLVLLVMALTFVILAGGSQLSWQGRPLELAGVPLPLPHRLLYELVPSFYSSGVGLFFPVRALSVAFACLALAAGYGVLALGAGRPRRTLLLAGLVLAAHLVEHRVRFPELLPVGSGRVMLPSVLEPIRGDPDCRAILHLPASWETDACHRYCLFSTLAGTRSVNPYDRDDLPIEVPAPDASEAERRAFLARLDSLGVRYIVVHEAFAPPRFEAVDLGWLERSLEGTGWPRRGAGMAVFRVPGQEPGGAR
jgi:hypothetical protein